MMMKTRNTIYIVIVGLLCGCGKKGETPKPPPTHPAKVTAATLITPTQNQACTTGALLYDTSKSVITFSWNKGDNAVSYKLYITNLLNQQTLVKTVTGTSANDTLPRHTPYSWYIVAVGSDAGNTATSDTWKFYNAGIPVATYAPFPASAVSPTNGQTLSQQTSLTLKWSGSSPDNDIVGYDVYFGTSTNPALYKSNVTDSFVDVSNLKSNTVYYWKIATKDYNGNTSTSQVFEFSNQ